MPATKLRLRSFLYSRNSGGQRPLPSMKCFLFSIHFRNFVANACEGEKTEPEADNTVFCQSRYHAKVFFKNKVNIVVHFLTAQALIYVHN